MTYDVLTPEQRTRFDRLTSRRCPTCGDPAALPTYTRCPARDTARAART